MKFNKGIIITSSISTKPDASPFDYLVMNTDSTSDAWTPTSIVNSGAILAWEVYDGNYDIGSLPSTPTYIYTETINNTPVFDFSGNTTGYTVVVKSTTGFTGFTELYLNSLDLTYLNVTEATDLSVLSFKSNQALTQVDTSTLINLTQITFRTTGLTSVDFVNNILLTDVWGYDCPDLNDIDVSTLVNLSGVLYLYGNSLVPMGLTTLALDALINDLASNNISGLDIKIADNVGSLTTAATISYNDLITDGCTIDVIDPAFPDITDPEPGILSLGVVTGTTAELSVTPTDNIGVTEIDIYQDTVFLETVVTAALSNYVVSGLTASNSYDFYTIARDAEANESVASNTVTANTTIVDIIDPVLTGILTFNNVTETTVELSGVSATDNIEVGGFNIYDGVSLLGQIPGTFLNASVLSGLTASTAYSDVTAVAYDTTGNESNASNSISFITDEVFVGSGSTPILYNYRILDGETNSDRIYFDSTDIITATTVTGLEIGNDLGIQVTGVTINSGLLVDHFFTVDTDFNFWDNYAIRYEGGSDIGVFPFTLQNIKNFIAEPISTIFRYASPAGGGTHDGTSEANAWTIAEALSNKQAGMTIYLKAGDYPEAQVDIDGTATTPLTPIKFIGYKTTPGDITNMYYNYTRPTGSNEGSHTLDSAEMPTFTGTNVSNILFQVDNDNTIIRNVQCFDGNYNFRTNSGGTTNIIYDNCFSLKARSTKSGLSSAQFGTNHIRFINCLSINSEMANIFMGGDYGLIENCEAYSDVAGGGPASDYHIFIAGHDNIVRGNYAERAYPDSHGNHGIGIKTAGGYLADYNLFENNDVVGTLFGFELRHEDVQYNVIRNHNFLNGIINETVANYPLLFPSFDKVPGGLSIRDDAKYNIVEDCYFENTRIGIYFRDSSEEGTQISARYNTIRNCVFDRGQSAIWAANVSADSRVIENNIVNCVFYSFTNFIGSGASILSDDVNYIINSIIMDCDVRIEGNASTLYGLGGTREESCAYYNNGYESPPVHSWYPNSVDGVDPQFVDVSNANFRLQVATSALIKDGGQNSTLVNYDKDKIELTSGTYPIGSYDK